MAAVNWRLTARLQDGLPVVTPFLMRWNTTSGLLADMFAHAAGYLPLLDAVTQSLIMEAAIEIPIALPGGLKSAPVALSQNAWAAGLDYESASGPQKVGFSLPNFIPAGYLAEVPSVVDSGNAAVLAFNTYLTTLANTTLATDDDYIILNSFRSGEVSTRKHRRQVARAKLAP